MKTPLYLSVEQELVLREHILLGGVVPPELQQMTEPAARTVPGSPTDDQFCHHFIVVSDVPWGAEGPGWRPTLIGPIHETYASEALAEVKAMLRALGHVAVDVFDFYKDGEPVLPNI